MDLTGHWTATSSIPAAARQSVAVVLRPAAARQSVAVGLRPAAARQSVAVGLGSCCSTKSAAVSVSQDAARQSAAVVSGACGDVGAPYDPQSPTKLMLSANTPRP